MTTPITAASILQSLNPAQRRAVSSNASTVAILAGPGSGKTHTLTSRVVWLMQEAAYRPEDIIVATFTVKAAREMKERISKIFGDGREKKIILGTFHSVARRYLSAYGQRIGLDQTFGIADDADSRALIARICKRLQLACDPAKARAWISKKKAKGSGAEKSPERKVSDNTPELRDLDSCFQEYQSHLERANLLDYDDLLVKCVQLLQKCPSCVSNIQAVLIDEYQDTNGVQYELMKLFAQKKKRITIVGDPDQSIYGWRSADIGNLWKMLKDYPGTAQVSLEENYRSSQAILDLSLLVIQQDKERYQKVLKPVHGRGVRPILRRLKTASMEAEWIVSEIRRVVMLSGKMLTHKDVAILLRSAALSRNIESALGKAGIGYKMVGGFKFYERAEIKILLDYLRVIHQPENNDALARIINVPKRGIGEGTVKSLLEEAENASLSLWTVLNKHCRGERSAKTKIMKQAEQRISVGLLRTLHAIRKRVDAISQGMPYGLVEVIQQLLTSLNFKQFLKETHADDHQQRWANVDEFVNLAADLMQESDRAGDDSLPDIHGVYQRKEVDVLAKFLANVSLASEIQTGENGEESAAVVTISTIHAAKGLEWPVVFVPAAYDGSIPHSLAREDSYDEERRLLYVAMTRAQSLLYLSCPTFGSIGNSQRTELSPFVAPLCASFTRKGPCLDRPVVEQIALALGRKLPPSDSEIFASLPAMFSSEDNMFPEDPEDAEKTSRWSAHQSEEPQSKRQRLLRSTRISSETRVAEWCIPAATTMDQAASFTVSSLPGFLSASTYQDKLSKAMAAVEAEKAAAAAHKWKRAATTKRCADQKSILGFVRSKSGSDIPNFNSGMSKPAPASLVRHPAKGTRAPNVRNSAPASTSDSALASHKVATGRVLFRPTMRKRDHHPDGSRNLSRSLSCSPTRADKGNKDLPEDDEPVEPTRPAACLHATTCGLTKGLGGLDGNFKWPSGLVRQTMAPLDRLRKPFKPLTRNI